MVLNDNVLAISFRRNPKTASMSNTKEMNVLVRKKGLANAFTGSNEAQYN